MASSRSKTASASSATTSSTDVEKARPPAAAASGKREIGYSPNYGLWSSSSDLALFPMLQGRSLFTELERMAETDDTVGAMMWCITTTVAQVVWKHVAQVDGADDDSSEEAVNAAKFADTFMLDMEESWNDHLDTALKMCVFGFSTAEIVLKQRLGGDTSRFNDKLWGVATLAARDPTTILGWKYSDNGRTLEAAQQSTYQGSATIPIWKLVHYRTTGAAESPWGRSLFQNAWRSWKLKVTLQDVEAIGAERELVGLPVFEMPEEVINSASEVDDNGQPTEEAKKAQAKIRGAQDAVSNLRFNRRGGLVKPSDTFAEDVSGDRTKKYDFKLVTTAGQRSMDIRQPIRDYDRAIARVAMMQFLHLGDRSTGSYSLSDDQSSMAVRSMMALVQKIANEWTKKVLPLAWTANAMDKRFMPRLGFSQLNKEGMQQMGAFLNGLARAAGLWEGDADARAGIMKAVNLPYNREAQSQAAETAKKKANTEADGQQQLNLPFGGSGSKKDPNDDQQDA